MASLSLERRAQLAAPLPIGSVAVNSRVLQSPLSGVTDRVFRRLVRRYAPDSMLYSEMASARELPHLQRWSRLVDVDPGESPISIQLFDGRPDFMAEAARRAVAQGTDTIDINMGCPANKVTCKGGGSSLLREPELAVAIVRAVVQAVEVPVTVKTRLGWDEANLNILDFARRLEDAGAQMLTLHGRTRAQGYQGAARWEWIARVKAALSIPVIANGDITSVAAAARCLEQTGADGVMCARGTLGYPFLVGEIDCFLKTGCVPEPPDLATRLQCARDHLLGLWEYKGDRGLYQSRKHMTWYVKGFPGAGELRDRLARLSSVEEGCRLLEEAIACYNGVPSQSGLEPLFT